MLQNESLEYELSFKCYSGGKYISLILIISKFRENFVTLVAIITKKGK